jgi:cephalosporin-C deacetylase-like acetyl esterase
MKLSQFPILLRYRHALQVLVVPDGLEIATYQKQIDVVMVRFLQYSDVMVYGIQLAMTAAFDGNLECV